MVTCISTVIEKINECKESLDNARKNIATEIRNKNISANDTDSFDVLASKIGTIKTGKYHSGDILDKSFINSSLQILK